MAAHRSWSYRSVRRCRAWHGDGRPHSGLSFGAGVVGAGPAPRRTVALTGKVPGGPAALLQVVENRGTGRPVESLTGRAPPGQHGLGESKFRGLEGALWVGRVPVRGPGQRAGHRQVEPEYRVFGTRSGAGAITGPDIDERCAERVGVRRGAARVVTADRAGATGHGRRHLLS